MLIQETSLAHWIKHFYGYGTWSAKIWFVAREESGGELPEEVAERIDYFRQTHSNATGAVLCEIREVYKQLIFRFDGPKAAFYKTHFDYRFGSDPVLHGYWKNLIAFTNAVLDNYGVDIDHYQKHVFTAAPPANEAWIKLFPLPGPHTHSWYYNWLDMPNMPFLKNRKLYEETFYQDRMSTLLNQIRAHRPAVVLMYGMTNINGLKKSLTEFFQDLIFKSVPATKMVIPQHHVAQVGPTRIIITTQIPGLRHNRIETGFDWKAFGSMYKI